MPDPLDRVAFGGEEEELEVIYSDKEALKGLRSRTTPQAADGQDQDAPKGGKNGKEGKKDDKADKAAEE